MLNWKSIAKLKADSDSDIPVYKDTNSVHQEHTPKYHQLVSQNS